MTVEVVRSAEVSEDLGAAIRALLDVTFEEPFSDEDWQHTLGGWHVLVDDGGALVAHAAVVPRTLWVGEQQVRCGYVEGVATRADHQHKGLGSLAMTEADRIIRAFCEMGALSTGRPPFYERLGWERWHGPSFVRTATGVVRTPDEDDGILVLRFGPTADVDLTSAITCEDRPGDAW